MFHRSSHRRCSVKKVFLEIWQTPQENTCTRVPFLITVTQVFSCELCEIFKNAFLTKHLWTTASGFSFTIEKKFNQHVLRTCFCVSKTKYVFLCNQKMDQTSKMETFATIVDSSKTLSTVAKLCIFEISGDPA